MATAETLWAGVVGAISAALAGIFSWAWQLSQRVSILEANHAADQKTAARLEAAIRQLDVKVDRMFQFLLEGKHPRGERPLDDG
jgi:hypothetical protein